MRIKSFQFKDHAPEGWELSQVDLHDGINLFVGISGAGKSRVLNMLTNIGAFVAQEKRFCDGTWTLCFEHKHKQYTWQYSGRTYRDQQSQIDAEQLWLGSPTNQEKVIFTRREDRFTFEGQSVPKLSKRSPAISLLKEEPDIADVHDAFTKILRRDFFGEDLSNSVSLQPISTRLMRTIEEDRNIEHLFGKGLALGAQLFLLSKYFPDSYSEIVNQFRSVFPFIEDFRVAANSETNFEVPIAGEYPIPWIKEKGSNAYIPIMQVSSGMQKVLLIITDVISGPAEMLYLVDEYENSLGINAIDFLPRFLNESGRGRQYIVTSHHPSLINAVPPEEWFIVHRRGTTIMVKPGEVLMKEYGPSKQQKFTKLMNDPFFSNGVE